MRGQTRDRRRRGNWRSPQEDLGAFLRSCTGQTLTWVSFFDKTQIPTPRSAVVSLPYPSPHRHVSILALTHRKDPMADDEKIEVPDLPEEEEELAKKDQKKSIKHFLAGGEVLGSPQPRLAHSPHDPHCTQLLLSSILRYQWVRRRCHNDSARCTEDSPPVSEFHLIKERERVAPGVAGLSESSNIRQSPSHVTPFGPSCPAVRQEQRPQDFGVADSGQHLQAGGGPRPLQGDPPQPHGRRPGQAGLALPRIAQCQF